VIPVQTITLRPKAVADDFAAARLLSGVDAHGELLSEQIGWLGRSRRSFYRLIKHHHLGEEGVNVARMH